MLTKVEFSYPMGFKGDPQEPADFPFPDVPNYGYSRKAINPLVRLTLAVLVTVGCGGSPVSASRPESADAAAPALGVIVVTPVPEGPGNQRHRNPEKKAGKSSRPPSLIGCPKNYRGENMLGSQLRVSGDVVKVCTPNGWQDPSIWDKITDEAGNLIP